MAVIFGNSMRKSEILERVGDITQICDARKMIFTDGKSSGVNVIDVKTGCGINEINLLKEKIKGVLLL